MALTPGELTLLHVYNDVQNYPTIADVAVKLGKKVQTIKNAVSKIRKKALSDITCPPVVNRAAKLIPMSEDQERFMEEWGPDECIEELLRIAEANPDKVITRNFFRVTSKISESTWNRYFGTFQEFKRQSGIKLSRQQHNLERHIAKHASVDHYRRMNIERRDYAEKYVRPNFKRFKTAILCSDLHDKEIDPFFLRVLIDATKRVAPDLVCYVGDIFDLPEFGRFTVDPREWDVVGRIKFAHSNIFDPMRNAAPDAQFDFIEGNHEARLIRLLADATPALRAVLSDLHGMTIAQLLGLDKFEVNYIAKADLASYTQREFEKELANNYKIYWGCLLAHHFPHARSMGIPGVNGHHHSHQVWPMFSPIFGAYEWHQMGAGHRRSASYTEGEKWHNGFAIAHVDTEKRSVQFEYVPIGNFAVVGGKWYSRESSEILTHSTT